MVFLFHFPVVMQITSLLFIETGISFQNEVQHAQQTFAYYLLHRFIQLIGNHWYPFLEERRSRVIYCLFISSFTREVKMLNYF